MEYFYFILDYIKLNIENNYSSSMIIFFIFLLFYNSISLPGSPIFMAAAGYFFGLLVGFLVSILSIVFGSTFFFLISRLLLRKLFPNIYLKYSNKISKYISNSSYEYLILFRIIPGTPLMIQNLCISITKVNVAKFFTTTFLGLTPSIFIIVYVGNKLNDFTSLNNMKVENIFSLEFLLFIIVIIFFLMIRIFYKKK